MVKERAKIDLTKFCSRDHSNRTKPFSRGKWTYATDGRICIRVPRLTDIPENKKAPNCEQIFKKADENSPYEWVAVPEMTVETVICFDCKGSGKWRDIDDTNHPCEECDGEGKVQEIKAVKIPLGDLTIALSNVYLDLIRKELSNPQIGLIKEAEESHPSMPVKIRFDGGEGLLMPIKISGGVL